MAEVHAAAFASGETWNEAAIRSLLDRPGTCPVALPPEAFALLQILPPEAELLTIAVHPDAQGRGMGRRLLSDALSVAAAAGCDVLHLEVASDNVAARALYDRAGFAETGRRRGYYARPGATPADALTMAVSLPAQQSGSRPSG
jgi:ribosomal-protein-alanine N-acetyltransferase